MFTQVVTATGGARVNVVQHGDQYNYIYRGAPPYRVEPFPLNAAHTVPEALARVPSRLLAARHRVVPFFPRPESALLEAWRDQPSPGLSVRLVHAEGGSGKTRLAQEFAARSAEAGWAVALARHRSEVASAGAGDESLTVRPPGLVLVVDYAERWPLADLITLVRQHRDAARDRLRILLLARPAGTWWQGLMHQFAKLDVLDVAAVKLEALPDIPETRAAVYTAARDRFAEIFALADTASLGVPERLADPQFGLTLTVHMRALIDVDAASRGREPPSGSDQASLSSYLLDREYDHWRSSHDQGRGPVRSTELQMSRAVYVAVLTRSLTPAAAAAALTRADAAATRAAADLLVEDHGRCYPPEDPGLALDPLAPDRLGEDYLALSLPGQEEEFGYYATDPWTITAPGLLLKPADANAEPAAYTRQAVSTLIEAAHRWPHVTARHVGPLLRRSPDLALAAGSAALTRLSDLPSLDLGVLESIESCLPDHAHIDLDLGSAAVFARLIRHRLARTTEPAERAALFTQLGWRYGNAGLHEQALSATTQAVDQYRALSKTDPRTYLPHLAVALGNLGGRLALAGSRAQAVESAQEAVSLYRDLSQLRPAIYLPDFAAALNGLSNRLADAGRWNEALAPAREAVRLRRQQAETEPDRYERSLAIALTSLGIRYSQAGLSAQALGPAREAVAMLRTLVQANPPAHHPDLARALNSLGNRLLELGRRQEALEATREAVEIRREIAAINPGAHHDSLAMELNNLGTQYARLGHKEESLAATQEAVDLFRALVSQNPAAHLPGLASALDNLGSRLHQLGHTEQALAPTREAVRLLRTLAQEEPAAHAPDLARAVTNIGIKLTLAGRVLEASGPAQEAVDLYRTLTENPDSAKHLPGLATALQALSTLYARKERPDQALSPAREAVAVQRRLAANNPAVHLPALAKALNSLGICLTHAGRPRDAAPLMDEAVEIYTQLEAQRPGEFAKLLRAALTTRDTRKTWSAVHSEPSLSERL